MEEKGSVAHEAFGNTLRYYPLISKEEYRKSSLILQLWATIIISRFYYFRIMKKTFFSLLAWLNKKLLPSFSKQQLDIAKAKKWQLAIIGWRAYVTLNALS